MTPEEYLKEKYPEDDRDLSFLAHRFICQVMREYSNLPKWISVKDSAPDLIEGENYSENVLAIVEGEVCVMCYCYNPSEDESERGYFWANCHGDINGEAHFDDDYIVEKWQPIPKAI